VLGEHATKITQVLRAYEQGIGQLINPAKCSMMFGSVCSEEDNVSVKAILYLGLPTPDDRMKKGQFRSTKERLSKRFSSWAEKYMSGGAKEVLIKSIAQAIPTYVMGVFKLPSNFCEELTQMIRYFWWREEGGQRKVHWIAWEKLLMPKCAGGMGFRDMKLFNQALLA
jgi:hypothetical protein